MIDRLFNTHLEETFGILFCCLLFLIISFYYKKYPPKEINHVYGFRTRRTMSNQDIWDVANLRAANDMFKYSIILTIIGILILMFNVPYPMIVFIAATLIGLAITVWTTYQYIDRRFDKNGNRR